MSETATSFILPASVANAIPTMVRNELGRLSAQKQAEFLEEYLRGAKSTGMGYVCWLLFGLHYAYVGRWGLQAAFWLTAGGGGLWAFIDLFRMPTIVANFNKDLATNVMRNLKAIST